MSEEKKPMKRTSTAKSSVKTVEKAPKAVKEAKPASPVKTDFSGKYHYAHGKRKTASACVRVYEDGKGEITVNGRSFHEYFQIGTLFGLIKSPLKMAGIEKFSIAAKIIGGGVSAQADALRHGIARALVEMNPAFRSVLKKAGQLTRDDRKVERKKPGRKKARRGQQWVKR